MIVSVLNFFAWLVPPAAGYLLARDMRQERLHKDDPSYPRFWTKDPEPVRRENRDPLIDAFLAVSPIIKEATAAFTRASHPEETER